MCVFVRACVCACVLNIHDREGSIVLRRTHVARESLHVVVWVRVCMQWEEDLVQCESPL